MPLPPLPTLGEDEKENIQGLWLYLGRLKDALDNFTPSEVAARLDVGALGTGPGSPFNGITVPVATPTPATPVMAVPIGFYRQIVVSWAIDINPFITGWEVQRADNLAFTTNVTTRTSAYALMFVDNDIPDSTTRYYRIRALTADPLIMSSFTAVQGATTLADDTGVMTSLANAAVLIQRAHIHNLVVDSALIADASILTAKIADLAVTTAKIALLAVDTAQINALAVTTAKIANLAVTNAKINDLSADKITAGTISVLVSLTNNTIKLDGTTNQITITDTQGSPKIRVLIGKLGAGSSDYGLQVFNSAGNIMFDTLDQGVNNLGIKDLEVISAKLNDLAVLTGKIANNAVTLLASTATSSAAYSNTGTTYTDVVTVTLTTLATPTLIAIDGNFLITNTSGARKKITIAWALLRDSTILRELGRAVSLDATGAAGGADSEIIPIVVSYIDPAPTAASHTYKLQAKCVTTTTQIDGDVFDIGVFHTKGK